MQIWGDVIDWRGGAVINDVYWVERDSGPMMDEFGRHSHFNPQEIGFDV